MNENTDEIQNLIRKRNNYDIDSFRSVIKNFLSKHVQKNTFKTLSDNFPTIIEPVYIGENVILGDDLLLGPNVYVGDNVELGDYVELSNTIILDNAKLDEIIKLDYCIVDKNSQINFNNFSTSNSILMGSADSIDKLEKKSYE